MNRNDDGSLPDTLVQKPGHCSCDLRTGRQKISRPSAARSPLAVWLSRRFKLEVAAVRDLGLRNAEDREIFDAARKADVVVVTKDRDFVDLLERYGPPPKVLWVTCGNTSNARVRRVLAKEFPSALELLNGGEALVELTDLGEI
jgi:predicted nuclease of predicted toxin-antitoxin system